MGFLATEAGDAVTPEFFKMQMDRLSGLRFSPAHLETHWEALCDLPDAVLEAAVTVAQRTRVEFPTPVELRRDADTARPPMAPLPDRSESLPKPVDLGTGKLADGTTVALPPATRLWHYYCEECSDTGIQSLWCGAGRRQPWLPIIECETYKCKSIKAGSLTYGHEWMRPCACAATNPAVMRKREDQAKYAQQAGKVGS